MLKDEAKYWWDHQEWPHWSDTQDRADVLRASLMMDEARTILEEVEMRLRERQA
jgi:hypothetical protein